MNPKQINVEENGYTKAIVPVEGTILLACAVLLSCDSHSNICFHILLRL